METHFEIKYVLPQQIFSLPNYIHSWNFRDQYLLSNWAVMAMILALLKQECVTFNCIIFYYRTPGFSQGCFSAADRNCAVRHWLLRECDLMTLFSEWVSASPQARRKRNCVLMWCVLSQDYQRKYKWDTICSYIKSLSIWVPQCCAL